VRRLMRYTHGVGWENLVPGLPDRMWETIGGQAINAQGDFVFASIEDTPSGNNRWLNLFDAGTNLTQRLITYDGESSVRAMMADNGDALLVVHNPYKLDAYRYNAEDGSLTDMSTLLPPGFRLMLTNLPHMNQAGDIVLGALSPTRSGDFYTYRFLRANSECLVPISSLDGTYISEFAVSNAGQMYFWLFAEHESLLGVLNVPEPSGTLAYIVGVILAAAVGRRRL
jgi:hypothetical protein